jgi:NAD+ kinase
LRIAIFGRSFDESFQPSLQNLFDSLNEYKVEVFVYQPFYPFLKENIELGEVKGFYRNYADFPENIDFLFSLGGDGTILGAITHIRDRETPIVGINTGRLGFLANINRQQLPELIPALIQKNYSIDSRAMLELETKKGRFGKNNIALNELTVHKKDSASMITVHTYADNEYLNSYWADGLIVSTPTGSTAYSLSCGGPIISPHSKNIGITPIAPHNLNVRPFVVNDNIEIRLEVEGRGDEFLVSLDSRSETISSEEHLRIRKSKFETKLVELEGQNFYRTLRSKLLWGKDKRN